MLRVGLRCSPAFFVCLLGFVAVCTRKTRILDVVYNASNNELVRTKTLVKNAIVVVREAELIFACTLKSCATEKHKCC